VYCCLSSGTFEPHLADKLFLQLLLASKSSQNWFITKKKYITLHLSTQHFLQSTFLLIVPHFSNFRKPSGSFPGNHFLISPSATYSVLTNCCTFRIRFSCVNSDYVGQISIFISHCDYVSVKNNSCFFAFSNSGTIYLKNTVKASI
jgi:hypothetical protein